ncbi:RNA polymerase sigma factor [Pedobacter metabolipauper]|uniref:RNA polymerase sigma-70 factor (ECF subfamily) n=1 Tax=Pedobacter metabolipauper TaxID=425513 RepID=A0A4R6SXS9_9SPHI|nr:sigma-70 family RNA polymerase sigma factor [Pedobacter metabolipauper]TDQ10266.1 RNA polymerase sigma-70 factor (ECF subfamily) [Pedobacter metabolipauper]
MAIKPLHNEKDLLQRIADGDDRAFAELFRAYHEPLAKYIFTLLESVQMCEEIVQDVFVKIWENRLALPMQDRFTSYMFILTRNYTINCIRKIIRDRKQGQLYMDDALQYNEEQDAFKLDDEYQDVLNRAVAQLPTSQQKVLMFRQQGLKTREIAEKMGISTDSVKKYQQWAASSVAKFIKLHTTLGVVLMFIKH